MKIESKRHFIFTTFFFNLCRIMLDIFETYEHLKLDANPTCFYYIDITEINTELFYGSYQPFRHITLSRVILIYYIHCCGVVGMWPVWLRDAADTCGTFIYQ